VEVPWDADVKADVVTQMSRGAGDDSKALFDQCLEEMLEALSEQGYDCMSVLEETPVSMVKVLGALQQIEYDRGAVRSYTICGIVSDDTLIGGYDTSLKRNGLELIYPLDLAEKVVNEICREECPEEDGAHEIEASRMSILSYNMSWSAQVAVKRAIEEDFPDEELKRYAAARKIQYQDLMEMVYGGGYAENLRMLKVTEVSVWLLSVFIIIVCMIQIINTLQANMRLRRRELWLYDVVGMEPKQKFKMLQIEHGLSAIVAMVTGMIASFAFSYWMLEGMLDVNETQ
jgi:hypothetical protein